MANSDQIKELIKSHVTNDEERFITISLQIAAHEAKLGRTFFADEIKKIVDNRKVTTPKVKSLKNTLEGLFDESYGQEKLIELIIPKQLKDRLNRVFDEYRNRGTLTKYGLENRRKLLLAGPPGTGKTMTASIIARELRLPLYNVNMDRLVSKFMGETSSNLRLAFEFINNNVGVYLFDEFDTIGTERLRDNDVGEMRRVLNSFLQFIEHDKSSAIIIAATNNPSMLDQALFRRFDDVFYYDYPSKEEIVKLIDSTLDDFKGRFKTETITNNISSLSHAEIRLACQDAIKESILSNKFKVSKEMVLRSINARVAAYHQKD